MIPHLAHFPASEIRDWVESFVQVSDGQSGLHDAA